MATISTHVPQKNGVLFTAQFDCIIGVVVDVVNSSNIIIFKVFNGSSVKQVIASNIVLGTKISNIIMKLGDELVTSNGTSPSNTPHAASIYITGVSA